MAKPVTMKPGTMRVLIGDGESPEVFAAPCGFTSKAFNRTKNLNEVSVPDCDDPDAAIVLEREVVSIDWNVSGEGVLPADAFDTWDEWFESTAEKNVRIEFAAADGGALTYTGPAHLATLQIGAQQGNRISINVSIQGSGALVRSPSV